MEEAVIVSAVRTPVGSFGGQFKDVTATELGADAARAALERAKIAGEEVDEVVLGCVLGGALSDGFDRLIFGHVTDFIDFHVWPVFNVADMAIVGGMLVIVYELTFRQPRDVSPAVEL